MPSHPCLLHPCRHDADILPQRARMKPKFSLQRWGLAFAALVLTMPIAWAQSTDLSACMAELRPAARTGKVSDATWTRHTAGLQADFSVIEKLNFQPEFRTAIWDYMSALVDEERVADGAARLAQHRQALARAEERFGVDPATVVAGWGVESNFGQTFGKYPLVQALGTLSCHGRRQSYFRGEFFAALRILQAGHIAPERLVGSWAGAFGHTQFMPTTFERLAQDFDGDGRRDLMDSVPDALASTAYFLSQAGWHPSQVWGWEGKLPAGLNLTGEGPKTKRPLAEWPARAPTRRPPARPPPAARPSCPCRPKCDCTEHAANRPKAPPRVGAREPHSRSLEPE